MRGRMAWDTERLERDPGQLARPGPLEQDVRVVGPEPQLWRREVVDPFERDPLVGGHVDGRTCCFGQAGAPTEVVPVPVRDQDRNARCAEALELALELRRLATRVDHDGVRGP